MYFIIIKQVSIENIENLIHIRRIIHFCKKSKKSLELHSPHHVDDIMLLESDISTLESLIDAVNDKEEPNIRLKLAKIT